jgi:valyl-tRNA synthetase
MIAAWPQADKKLMDAEAEALFERFQGVVTAIRNTRAELNIPLESRPAVHLASAKPDVRKFFDDHRPLLQTLAATGDVSVEAAHRKASQAAATVVDGVEVVIPLTGLIDAGKERARLQQRVDELTKQLAGIESRLKDAQFTARAPKEVVEQTRERRAQLQETLKKFSDHLALLKTM